MAELDGERGWVPATFLEEPKAAAWKKSEIPLPYL